MKISHPIVELPNKFDRRDLYEWLRKRDARWEVYKNAQQKDKLNRHLSTESILEDSSISPEVSTRASQNQLKKQELLTFKEIQRLFIGPQGYYWTLTPDTLDSLIYTSTFSPRAKFKKNQTQHAYKTPPHLLTGENRVVGFILSPEDVAIKLRMLKRLTVELQREVSILEKVMVFHERDLKSAVQGWSREQLANWWKLPQVVEEIQKKIDDEIKIKGGPSYSSLPFTELYPRDLSTERGRVLARLNRDSRGLYLRPLWHKIQKINLFDLKEIDFNRLNKKYAKLPKYEAYSLNDLSEKILKIKIFEEIYSGLDTCQKLEPDQFNPPIIWSRVLERMKPRESDATGLYNDTQPYEIPLGVQMASEYRSFESLFFHRCFYIKVLKQLHQCFTVPFSIDSQFYSNIEIQLSKDSSGTVSSSLGPQHAGLKALTQDKKRRFITPDPELDRHEDAVKVQLARVRSSPYNANEVAKWSYNFESVKEYNHLFNRYQELLNKQRQLHFDQHTNCLSKLHARPTYWGLTSYIPSPWEVFFRNPNLNTEQYTEIDLSGAGLKDKDFIILANKPPVLAPYTKINLSNNEGLTGQGLDKETNFIDYNFNKHLTNLNFSRCNLYGLHPLIDLQFLILLDVSYNNLTDYNLELISDLKNLTCLNISDNKFEDIQLLAKLEKLIELDVSGNNIQTLATILNPDLKILKAGRNPLKGSWVRVLPVLSKLETLDLTKYGTNFTPPSDIHNFIDRFPQLQLLKLGEEHDVEFVDETEDHITDEEQI